MAIEDYDQDSSSLKETVNAVRGSLAFYDLEFADISSFNIYKVAHNNDYLVPGTGYTFMVKPNLPLNGDTGYLKFGKNTFAADLSSYSVGKYVISSLCRDDDTISSPFIPAFTNSAETGFEAKDVVLDVEDRYENYHGQKITFGKSKYASEGNDTITLTFPEYDNMYFTLLHKLWVDYSHDSQTGIYKGSKINIDNMIIDYMTTFFYFLTGVDGVTIKYFSKYTGLFAVNVPYSSLSSAPNDRSVKKLSCNYAYTYKEDLNPNILEDFNYISTGSGNIPNGSSIKPNTHDPLLNTYCKGVRVIKNNVGNYALDWTGYSNNSNFGGRASKFTANKKNKNNNNSDNNSRMNRGPNSNKQYNNGGYAF